MNSASIIERQYAELAEAVAQARTSLPDLEHCTKLIADVLEQGGKLLAAGNGGSAAGALHLCEELVGRYKENRRAIPAIALVADGTALTCISNDFGYEEVFARQIEALGAAGDVLVLFTSSGNSPNLVRALKAAKAKGMLTVIFSGRDGGRLKGLGDAEWIVPTPIGARAQELHEWGLHLVLEVVEDRLFG